MGEVTVSAKDKKKAKTDKDKRSQNRSTSDKEKEELEEATRKSLKAERKAAKRKAKEKKELAEVLEQSRLEAERGARVLQALPSKPIAPTPLNLFVSDVFGNLNVSSSAAPTSFFDPFASEESKKELPRVRNGIDMITCPKTGQIICRPRRNKENPSSDAPSHSFPPVHPSESKNSKVNNELGLERAKESLAPESKDTVADSVVLSAEHLPFSEAKSDSETELLLQFPAEGKPA
jgi:hypothetical protein